MHTPSPRSVAADLLNFCALHDGRTWSEEELNTWAAHIARSGPNAVSDYRQAVEEYYARPDAHRAGPGDITTRATTIRRARTGANRVPQIRKKREPMPDHVRAQINAIRNRARESTS